MVGVEEVGDRSARCWRICETFARSVAISFRQRAWERSSSAPMDISLK